MFDFLRPSLRLADLHTLLDAKGARWYRACLRITRDTALAEDAVQEALLKAWAERDKFRGEAELDTWIHRIALNAAIDMVRKQRPDSVEPEALEMHQADASHSPEAHYLTNAFGAEFTRAIARLTSMERESFVLKHVEGWSLNDIATSQQTSVNNTKQALFRAVRKLRTDLHEWRGAE